MCSGIIRPARDGRRVSRAIIDIICRTNVPLARGMNDREMRTKKGTRHGAA